MIAYIITAYKDPNHLGRLIKQLDYNSAFYIHIDSKVDISPFVKALSNFKNIHFCKNRHFVNWGSFAQVLCQKELLKCVLESTISFERVVCISGLDYPIYSNTQILKEFSSNKQREYIKAMNLTQSISKAQHKKVNLYHFFRDIRIIFPRIKRVFTGTSRIIMSALPFRKGLQTDFGTKRVDIYMGSDYWALTFDCAKFVYETMCIEKKLMNYFKYSYVPSEMCIQTIVFNSAYSKNAILYEGTTYPGLPILTPLHYIEYGNTIKIFSESHLNILVTSNKMFFRKASTGVSDTLLDKIDLTRISQK